MISLMRKRSMRTTKSLTCDVERKAYRKTACAMRLPLPAKRMNTRAVFKR